MLASVSAVLLCAYGVLGSSITPINHWSGGFQADLPVTFCDDGSSWTVKLTFSDPVNTLEVWVADATSQSPTEWTLTNKDFNGDHHNGDSVTVSILGHGSGDINPTITINDCGTGGSGTGTGSQTNAPGSATQGTVQPQATLPHTGGGNPNKDYGDALGKSILFFDAQRSGKLPANNPISWRGDSALDDCVVGGWYDAGDHVKFGLPFGSSTLLMLWSMYSFKDGYKAAGQMDQQVDMIKWATDYMLNAWNPTTKELVCQIGDGNVDHKFWGRPEDMTMDRPCFKLSPGKGGADVAGEWAAALAAAYVVFKDLGDTAYATKCLTAAESMYAFAKANPQKYSDTLNGAAMFYSSSGFKDEMCEGGAWLYRATNNPKYLEDAKSFYESAWGWSVSWDDKKVLCQELLWELTQTEQYKLDVQGFFKGWFANGMTYTPCGLAWRDQWGPNRYAGNTAFLALVAAEAGIDTLKMRTWAVEQINFLLGDNHEQGGCYSFAIGVGDKYPHNPHHRGASCPDRPAPCGEEMLHATTASPQLLVGALVGGPDASGKYVDDRENYVVNEVALDYNAGYHSALAGIEHLKETDNFPVTHNKCPCAS